jgi:hypothetical protein
MESQIKQEILDKNYTKTQIKIKFILFTFLKWFLSEIGVMLISMIPFFFGAKFFNFEPGIILIFLAGYITLQQTIFKKDYEKNIAKEHEKIKIYANILKKLI